MIAAMLSVVDQQGESFLASCESEIDTRKTMTDLIRPIESEPNQPIPLVETDIVKIDGQSVNIPVGVVLQLYPSPRVEIELNTLSNLTRGGDRLEIELRNGARLEVLLGALYFNPEKVILIPVSQPVTVIDNDCPLQEVSFAVLDFPQFYGMQDKWIDDGEQCVRIPNARLETSEWWIEITGVPNIREAEKALKQSRGHGITYKGSITCSDGATFLAKDVEPLLEALRFFLSIARGASCSLALVRGKDEVGRDSWVRWGAHHSEPWLDYHSAFMRFNSDILSDLFPKFLSLLESQTARKGATLRAFDWYLQSNVSAPYIGAILTLAALEGFSYLVLNGQKNKGERTGEFIGRALSKLQISLDLPENCEGLRSIRKKWVTGPHALADVRNDLIHPRKDLGDVSNMAYLEAWELGQWYFELMLLSRLGYQGRYRNRLADMKGDEDPLVPVPWASDVDSI